MGISTFEASLDPKEIIDKCLSCEKKRCTNCVAHMKFDRPKKRVDEDELIDLYNQGYSDMQIAKMLGVGDSTICHYRKELGLVSNTVKKLEERGEKIYDLYMKGMSDREIMEVLGVRRQVVESYRYKNGLPAHRKRRSRKKNEVGI